VKHQILVRGTGEVRVTPDRAVVFVTVDADGADRESAYNSAAESAARVDAVLADHATDIERTVTAALLVQPKTRWRKGEAVRTGWRASRRSIVEITGFGRLGELWAELAAAGATIDGPEWKVDEANEAYRDARVAAAADARRRAEAYASGLGIGLGPVTWMAEPGLRTGGSGPVEFLAAAPMARMAAAAELADADVIDISPEDVVVHASIDVSFGLTAS
jgi:uncharacterized protein YggE